MRLKQCLSCGKTFQTNRIDQTKCTACLEALRSTTIRDRVCRQCGTSFLGGPRAWYCPDCRKDRKKERDKRFQKNGAQRLLGSIDLCVICGKEYTVNSGRQKYCPDCAPAAVQEIDRAASREWAAAHSAATGYRTPEKKTGRKICVICGGIVPKGTSAVVCSPECDALRRKRAQEYADLRRGRRKKPPSIQRLDDKGENDND